MSGRLIDLSIDGAACECPRCEQSRWMKHLRSLLPDAEAKELSDWYNAMLDCEEDQSLSLYCYARRLKKLAAQVEEIALS